MAQRPSHVPKFGNWDANDNVAYTVVFDQARNNKGGKPFNPNDPAENPSAFALRPDDPLDVQRNRASFRPSPPSTWDKRPDAAPAPAPAPVRLYAPSPPPPPASERPNKGVTVPAFGAWNESDPSSGEGFTMIFSKAKDERKAGGPVHIPPLRNEPPAGSPLHEGYRQRHEAASPKKSSFWSCCGM